MRLLLVEDDLMLAGLLTRVLRQASYAIDTAATCRIAEESIAVNPYDLILLDWNLPDRSGLSLCHDARRQGIQCPVMFITGRDSPEDRIAALDAGADDFVVKPFHVDEFKARVRSCLRRRAQLVPAHLQVGNVTIDTNRRRVWCGSLETSLTPKEYSLLEYFARNADRVVSRRELIDHVWDENHEAAFRSLEVHANTLRQKLGAASTLLQTRRGHGYILTSEPPTAS